MEHRDLVAAHPCLRIAGDDLLVRRKAEEPERVVKSVPFPYVEEAIRLEQAGGEPLGVMHQMCIALQAESDAPVSRDHAPQRAGSRARASAHKQKPRVHGRAGRIPSLAARAPPASAPSRAIGTAPSSAAVAAAGGRSMAAPRPLDGIADTASSASRSFVGSGRADALRSPARVLDLRGPSTALGLEGDARLRPRILGVISQRTCLSGSKSSPSIPMLVVTVGVRAISTWTSFRLVPAPYRIGTMFTCILPVPDHRRDPPATVRTESSWHSRRTAGGGWLPTTRTGCSSRSPGRLAAGPPHRRR